jgi:hypothetical protein
VGRRKPRSTDYRDAVGIRHGPKESHQQAAHEVSREGGHAGAVESGFRGMRASAGEGSGKSATRQEGTGERDRPEIWGIMPL